MARAAGLTRIGKLLQMKILVVGSGAREHAIIKALIRTGTDASDIVCAPGNKYIAKQVEGRELALIHLSLFTIQIKP